MICVICGKETSGICQHDVVYVTPTYSFLRNREYKMHFRDTVKEQLKYEKYARGQIRFDKIYKEIKKIKEKLYYDEFILNIGRMFMVLG